MAATDNAHPVARNVGMIAAANVAILLATINVLMWTGALYEKLYLVTAGVFIGLPLLALAAGTWLYLKWKGATGGRLTLIMWLPILVSAMILPLGAFFHNANPIVHEVHVNLSGRELWLDPDTGARALLPGDAPGYFMPLARNPALNGRADQMAAYQGPLLAPGLTSMKVFHAAPPAQPQSVPVTVAPVPPHYERMLLMLGTFTPEDVFHHYYHYSDRIEVASIIDWKPEHVGNDFKIVNVYIHNLGELPVVRLEINDQPLRMPSSAAIAPLSAGACRHSHSSGTIARPNVPLKLRWQTAQVDAAWQAATVTVPAFAQAHPTRGRIESDSLHLYIKPDGSLAAQRAQVLEGGYAKKGVRVTSVEPPFAMTPPCGTAAGRYPTMEGVPD